MTDGFLRLIGGQRRGAAAWAARCVLRVCSVGYRAAIAARNHYYDALALPRWLEAPVFSVGNLTVGGTGKTPMAAWLCQQLLARGRRPAVVSRGYKASPGAPADELLVIARQCREAVVVSDADRLAGGRRAIETHGARAVVLDDGFQHRRLGRDLDILLIDATRPFGFGYLLPRGLLREPIRNLRRAGLIVVTRCDQAGCGAVDEIRRVLDRYGATAPLVRAVHRVSGFTDLSGRAVPVPAGGRIGALAGIARPEAFVRTLEGIGVAVAAQQRWPDHHVYGPQDAARIGGWIRDTRLDALVVTEKDAVKLARLEIDWPVPVRALRVEIDMLEGGGKMVGDMIDAVLREFDGDGASRNPPKEVMDP